LGGSVVAAPFADVAFQAGEAPDVGPGPVHGRGAGIPRISSHNLEVADRALIVEDEPEAIDAVVEILDSLGHSFDTACSQAEAFRRVRETDYSYILLDMEIPARSRTGTPRVQNSENFLERLEALAGPHKSGQASRKARECR